ncbi:hypothetical protein LJR267_009056 [Paraburkholderia hospita]|jgi:transposase|uniref:hypothetical protein n=1 Tax=Paraburkholderia hospita TaxID=169430 RepID=UPI001ABFFC7A|nr:hypothetical protein [Paraburkholderia hospita]HXI89459.1 hypothetical protein [Blastocatellia bacterium]
MRKDSASIANNTQAIVLAVSFEVAAAKWTFALPDGQRERPAVHTVAQPGRRR